MDKRHIILIVDNVELNRALLADVLTGQYEIMEASHSSEALSLLEQYGSCISAVLLDEDMRGQEGMEILSEMREKELIEDIPVIVLLSDNSSEYISKAYELGAADYICRPFDAVIIKRKIDNIILLQSRRQDLERLVELKIHERDRANMQLIDILSTIAEFRSLDPIFHVKRIRAFTEILLTELNKNYCKYDLNPFTISMIAHASTLHDLGKSVIPEEILNKSEKLSFEEFEQVKSHAQAGADMLEPVCSGSKDEIFRYAYEICRFHHERWDGLGYPDGLLQMEIPLSAQVVGLADAYDALVSDRACRPAFSHKEAVKMILDGKCGMFNPDLLKCFQEVEETLERHNSMLLRKQPEKLQKDTAQRRGVSQIWESGVSDRTLLLLEQERIKYQFMAALSNEVLFEYDIADDKVTFSDRVHKELGVPSVIKDLKNDRRNLRLLLPKDANDLIRRLIHTTKEEPFVRRQYLVKVADGTRKWYELSMRTMWNDGAHPVFIGVIGKMTNIHTRKLENVRLQEMAERDPLTKLYNQSVVKNLIKEILETNPEPIAALLFFDFDNFKEVNDTQGHPFGDRILCHIADNIRNAIRADDIAARVGGDEFIVFMRFFAKRQDIERRVDQLMKNICGTYEMYEFSVSIGVAVYPEDGHTYEALYEAADQALYISKNSGRAKYTFYSPNR